MYIYLVLLENEDGSIDYIDSAYSNYNDAELRVNEVVSNSVSLYPVIKEVMFHTKD